MTTIRPPKVRYLAIAGVVAVLVVVVGFIFIIGVGNNNGGESFPNLTTNSAAVTCATAHDVQNVFAPAVRDATKAMPDYSGTEKFGFKPPDNPVEIAPLQEALTARLAQIESKVQTVDAGTCTDKPTATVTNQDGSTVTLPVVYDNQPGSPINGSQSNQDPRTVPVTIGTSDNNQRTNTWSDLDNAYGNQKWYTNCVNDKLGMNWSQDVPKYEGTEDAHDNRFILAVNVAASMTDDQIRQQAANDGNPRVDKLPIVRTSSIINTRHLENQQCDRFVDARSMIRVSLGKVVFDDQGQFKDLEQDKGVFVDCHNMWFLPPAPPVPTTPGQPTTPGTTPPGTTPGTTPPVTTTQPPACTNGGVPPQCNQPKDPSAGAGSKGNVPTSVQGQAPVPDPTAEPRPTNPPTSYSPPAPPPPPHTTTAPPRTDPPVETTATGPPATGTQCPPGIPTC